MQTAVDDTVIPSVETRDPKFLADRSVLLLRSLQAKDREMGRRESDGVTEAAGGGLLSGAAGWKPEKRSKQKRKERREGVTRSIPLMSS